MNRSSSEGVAGQGSAAYFNQEAEKYDAAYDANTPGGYALRVRQQRVLELLGGRGGKVLDVGCGAGRMAAPLLDLGYEFWGVDAAPTMIEECRNRYRDTSRVHLSVADAHRIEFDDALFDAVICMGVIDRIQNWESAIAEMARVLKPGGTLIVTFPNLASPYAWWKNFIFYPAMAIIRPLYFRMTRRPPPSALYNRVDPKGRLSLLASFAKLQTASAVTRAFGGLELPVTEVVYYNFTLFLSPLDEWLPRLSMRLSERIEHLRSGGLRWIGAGYIVKARKGTGKTTVRP